MNAEKLLAIVPDEAELYVLDVGAKKAAVIDAIDSVIFAIQADARDADAWEANMLLRAMAAILRDQYFLAADSVRACLTPMSTRSPVTFLETAQQMSPGELHEILVALRCIPAR